MTIVMLFLAIIGLPLAVMSIVFALKYRNRSQLTYVDQGCLPLFESIVKTIEGIEILYKKKAIDPSLYFLTGSFANTGNLDIDRSTIYDPLSIDLLPAYKWLEARITKSPSGVNVNYKIRSDSTLEFKWDLLKTNEAFSFNALIKAPKGRMKSAEKLISFSHRITNLQGIRVESLSDLSRQSKNKIMSNRLAFTMIAAGLAGLLFLTLVPTKQVNYLLEDSSGKTFQASVEPRRNNLLRIETKHDRSSTEIKLEDFPSEYKISGLIIEEQKSIPAQIAVLSYTLAGGYFFVSSYLKRRKRRKLSQTMKT